MIRGLVFLTMLAVSFCYVFMSGQTKQSIGVPASAADLDVGRITQIDVANRQITIHGVVLRADRAGARSGGKTTVAVANSAMSYEGAEIEFDDLRVGDFVRARGMAMGDTFIATDIQKYPRPQRLL